ncbi:MAG: FAD-dependent oxidoreductase [Defluviitaleaceae bacterium]|nr:FAD-dependent oxidoreductase [Defluviitaleaceae bacterium]
MQKLNALFSPYVLKGKTVKNRFAVPAMVANYCTEGGDATEQYISYHEAKAKGGWGLIITEDYAVDPVGRGFKNVAGLWDDAQIESHSALPPRLHKHGAVVLAQIYHAGRQTSSAVIGGTPVAPSPIQCPFGMEIPKELTVDEINKIISQFGDTALRAKKCGFDGVEIHGGHGYLVAQFMSLYSNKRVDEFGGSLENRLKFPLGIVKDIRAKCGDDFIIGFRMSMDEVIEGGRTLLDSLAIVQELEAAGVDIIHASAGVYASADAIVPPSYTAHGWIADFAAQAKKVCEIPVIAVGRINDPRVANSIIASGKADFVGMARASLTDPAMPNKAIEGKFEDIRTCIGCNHGCLGLLFGNFPIKCVLNPELGKEHKGLPEKAASPKKIAIVGAGPAGLTAAIYGAKLGHSVTVFEKGERGGGQLYLAAIPPSKGEIAAFTRWQLTQIDKLGVEIKYNTEACADMLSSGGFEHIFVATGVVAADIPIPGTDLPNVVSAADVLSGKVQVGGNVVVIGGGGVGAETANHLGVHLKNVAIIEAGPAIAPDKPLAPRWQLLRQLEGRGVHVLTNTTVAEIQADSVLVKAANGTMPIPCDSVVLAVGSVPNNALAKQLEAKSLNFSVIGDADKVAGILEATEAAYEAVISL